MAALNFLAANIMSILKSLTALALASALACASPAFAAEDASHFLLTPAFMQKLNALQSDPSLAKFKDDNKDDDGDKDQSLEGIIKKAERDPRIKAALAKHGITGREYAYAAYAMLHAGMYVGTEKLMEKAKAEALYNSYTKEQKANIVLMRTMQKTK